jgi:hypothetical protein
MQSSGIRSTSKLLQQVVVEAIVKR